MAVQASPQPTSRYESAAEAERGLAGPWERDFKCMAASTLIAARDNRYGATDREQILVDTVGRYRNAIAEFARLTNLDLWYSRLDLGSAIEQMPPQAMATYGALWGRTLARARARRPILEVFQGLRRPERARLLGARSRGRVGPGYGREGPLMPDPMFGEPAFDREHPALQDPSGQATLAGTWSARHRSESCTYPGRRDDGRKHRVIRVRGFVNSNPLMSTCLEASR